jgi:hypothetical protein
LDVGRGKGEVVEVRTLILGLSGEIHGAWHAIRVLLGMPNRIVMWKAPLERRGRSVASLDWNGAWHARIYI